MLQLLFVAGEGKQQYHVKGFGCVDVLDVSLEEVHRQTLAILLIPFLNRLKARQLFVFILRGRMNAVKFLDDAVNLRRGDDIGVKSGELERQLDAASVFAVFREGFKEDHDILPVVLHQVLAEGDSLCVLILFCKSVILLRDVPDVGHVGRHLFKVSYKATEIMSHVVNALSPRQALDMRKNSGHEVDGCVFLCNQGFIFLNNLIRKLDGEPGGKFIHHFPVFALDPFRRKMLVYYLIEKTFETLVKQVDVNLRLQLTGNLLIGIFRLFEQDISDEVSFKKGVEIFLFLHFPFR